MNDAQAGHGNGEAASTPSFEAYGGSAPANYQRFFVPVIGRPLAYDLVEEAALREGERVLDVACGTGVVARLAAGRVGASGSVAGLDVNGGMIEVAREATPADLGIAWHEASADHAPFDDHSFDVALCQMGLQFFPDRDAALAEIRRVLAPDGRLALNVPGPTPEIFAIMGDALARHFDPSLRTFVGAVFSIHEAAPLEDVIRRAGFEEVAVRRYEKVLRLPAPAQFLWQYIRSTPLAAAVASADDDTRAAFEKEVTTRWEGFREDGSLRLDLGVLIATARGSERSLDPG